MAEDDATAARAKDAANLDAAAKAALASLQGVSFSSKGEHSRAQPRPVPQAQVQQASEKQDRLFVSKVPQSLGQAELRAHFAQFGDLTDVYLPAPPGGGGHKGICFVSFADASGIQKAIAHGAHEVQGSPISVDIAAPRAPPPSTVTASVQSGCRVFLTKVTADVTRADLQAHFCRFGELSDCYVPPGNKGIAFVSFKDPSTASSVVAHQQHEVKPGLVLIAAPAFDRPQQGSKGGGKGGFGGCGGGCNAFNGACGGCDLGSFAGFGGASCSGCGFSDFSMMQGFQNGRICPTGHARWLSCSRRHAGQPCTNLSLKSPALACPCMMSPQKLGQYWCMQGLQQLLLPPGKATANSVLQRIRETLNRTHISAADLLQSFLEDRASNAISATQLRAGLAKLGFELSEEEFQEDASGHVLLADLEKRLTRTGTKERQRSKPTADTEVQQKRAASHVPSLRNDVAPSDVAKQSVPDGLAGNDRHGALTARRMASHRRKPVELVPLTDSDFVLAKIRSLLLRRTCTSLQIQRAYLRALRLACKEQAKELARKVRSVDVLKCLDAKRKGSASREELCSGLERLGVGKLSASEKRDLFSALDAANSGNINLIEFLTSLKQAEKKARSQGQDELIDTWKPPPELADVSTSTTTDWSKRTLKFDSDFPDNERGTSKCLTSREVREVSQSLDFDISQSVDFDLAPHDMTASAGPLRAALAAPLGCGNLHDNYILRQRLVSNTRASHPPSLENERLPLYKHGRFRRAIADTRWGAEVVGLPDERMRRTCDGCLTASRPRRQDFMDRGREKFHAPLLQSVVDSVGQFQASQLQTQQGFGFANFGCPQMGQADYGAFQHPQAERPGPY
eukprot:s1890_g2.t1